MARIKELLPDPPVNFSVSPQDTVAHAVQLMSQENVGIVMVVEGNRLVGVFSERDLIRRVLGAGMNPEETLVEVAMTRRVVFAREHDDPEMCLKKMETEGCRHLPVYCGERPLAMLSIRDLMRYILSQKEDDLKMLEKYVSSP
jgi:CBS domain-containing protein